MLRGNTELLAFLLASKPSGYRLSDIRQRSAQLMCQPMVLCE